MSPIKSPVAHSEVQGLGADERLLLLLLSDRKAGPRPKTPSVLSWTPKRHKKPNHTSSRPSTAGLSRSQAAIAALASPKSPAHAHTLSANKVSRPSTPELPAAGHHYALQVQSLQPAEGNHASAAPATDPSSAKQLAEAVRQLLSGRSGYDQGECGQSTEAAAEQAITVPASTQAAPNQHQDSHHIHTCDADHQQVTGVKQEQAGQQLEQQQQCIVKPHEADILVITRPPSHEVHACGHGKSAGAHSMEHHTSSRPGTPSTCSSRHSSRPRTALGHIDKAAAAGLAAAASAAIESMVNSRPATANGVRLRTGLVRPLTAGPSRPATAGSSRPSTAHSLVAWMQSMPAGMSGGNRLAESLSDRVVLVDAMHSRLRQ
eukprot:jgi/Chrzof1/10717/Cz05g09260.t1